MYIVYCLGKCLNQPLDGKNIHETYLSQLLQDEAKQRQVNARHLNTSGGVCDGVNDAHPCLC